MPKFVTSVCVAGFAVGLAAVMCCWGRNPQGISRDGGWASVDTPPVQKEAAKFHLTYHSYDEILLSLEAQAAAHPSAGMAGD